MIIHEMQGHKKAPRNAGLRKSSAYSLIVKSLSQMYLNGCKVNINF